MRFCENAGVKLPFYHLKIRKQDLHLLFPIQNSDKTGYLLKK
jgi:hypothetical protein